MERSRKLVLTNWSKANTALQKYFEGNKSKLAQERKVSRTTVTAFFKCEPVSEAKFRKIAFGLHLNEQDWQIYSDAESAPKQEDWIEEVRSRCCEKILYQHGTIQLLNQTEVGVDQLYVDVWLLNRSPRTFQVSESKLLESFDLRNDRLGLGDRIKRNEGISVANENSRLLILGKPGSGKTTFLKHLAVDCCNGKFQPDLIPVLIELRRIRSTDQKLQDAVLERGQQNSQQKQKQSKKWILDTISEQLELDLQQTQNLLAQGKLLILMDGLDEVPTSSFRREVQNQVRELAQEAQLAGNRFILTCRTQIIENPPQGFTSVEVADFNLEQVKTFVENWFLASKLTKDEVAQKWKVFSDAIQANAALRELTVTPVLLSLMCWVFQDSGELPSQTALLYRKGIRLLLEKWNDRKEIPDWEVGTEEYRKLTPEQKEVLLMGIAAWKFENPGNFVIFEQADLVKQIAAFLHLANIRDAEAVLKAIEAQHGLLVERADELWSFSHLTFQEHFTSQWLTQLSSEQLAEKIVNQQWQEVIKQLVKFQQNSDRLLRLIKQAIDHSVSQDTKLQEFLTWVQEKAEVVSASYKPAAIRAFYFARDRDLVLIHALTHILDSAFAHVLNPALDNDLDRDLNLDRYLIRALALALDRDLNFALNSDLNFARVRARALNFTLDCAFDFAFSSTLASTLQHLRAKLPETLSTKNWESFEFWWRTNGQDWTEELRQIMIQHRNIGHDWQFREVQEQALQRYHDANKFLVELLKEPGAVSDAVRQEIEDNLLLPIAELKRRLPDLYE